MLVDNPPPSFPPDAARLLFYMHSASTTPPDLDFTISDISLVTRDGKTIKVSGDPVSINSASLVSGQIFIKDALVKGDTYAGIKVRVSKASIKRGEGRASLSTADQDLLIKTWIIIRPGETQVVSLAWNAESSIEDSYRFVPAIHAEEQSPSSRSLLLFVSNSGSDYISVIDRSLERVIGAVSVEGKPMGMALNSTQDLLYVVNSDARTISVIDTAQLTVINTIPLGAGIKPTEIAFMPDSQDSIDGKLYVVNRLSNDVTVVSTSARRILKTIPAGLSPSSIAADASRKEVYVTNERGNTVNIINAIDDTVAATVIVDKRPMGMITGKDKLYVLNEGSNNVSIVSLAARKVSGIITLRDAPRKGLRAFSDRVFLASTSADTLAFVNSFDVVTRTIPAPSGPIAITGDERRNMLYVVNAGDGAVSLVEPIGERFIKKIFIGKNPYWAVLIDR